METLNRSNFLEETIKTLDDITPAICIKGDTNDQFINKEGNFIDIKEALMTALLKKGYDFIVEFNPATYDILFGDEHYSIPSEDQCMRDDFKKLNITVKGPDDKNLIPALLDNSRLKAPTGILPDKIFMAMVSEAIKKHKKKCAIIIENAHSFIQADGSLSPSMERFTNRDVLREFVHMLQAVSNNHLILIDREDSVNPKIEQEIPFKEVPITTREEIKRLLNGIVELGKLPEEFVARIIDLSAGTRIIDLRKLIKENKDKPPDSIIQKLIKFKEQQVQKLAGNSIKCSLRKVDKSQIALEPKEMAFWDELAILLKNNSENLPHGILLTGPPGTGKSIRAQYLASTMDVPFLQLDDIGSKGLRGKKEEKVRRAFNAAIQLKPCVFFIDEIDKAWPTTEGSDGLSANDDAEVMAYIQTMMDGDEMEGIVIIGACNNPERMPEAMKRSGRFGLKIPALPPKDDAAERDVFLKVWNQNKSLRNIKPNEDIISLITAKAENATGADFKELIRRASAGLEAKRFSSIDEALLYHLERFDFTKGEAFLAQQEMAIKMDTAHLDKDEIKGNGTSENAEMRATMALCNIKARAVKEIKELKGKKIALEEDLHNLETKVQEENDLLHLESLRLDSKLQRIEGEQEHVARLRKELSDDRKAFDEERRDFYIDRDKENEGIQSKVQKLEEFIQDVPFLWRGKLRSQLDGIDIHQKIHRTRKVQPSKPMESEPDKEIIIKETAVLEIIKPTPKKNTAEIKESETVINEKINYIRKILTDKKLSDDFAKMWRIRFILTTLVGTQSTEYFDILETLLKIKDYEKIVLLGLAGNEHPRAWQIRDKFTDDEEVREENILSLANIENRSKSSINFLSLPSTLHSEMIMSWVGNYTEKYRNLQKKFLTDYYNSRTFAGALAFSTAGNSDKEAYTIRSFALNHGDIWGRTENKIEKDPGPSIAESLIYLDSNQDFQLRQTLLSNSRCHPNHIAIGLAGVKNNRKKLDMLKDLAEKGACKEAIIFSFGDFQTTENWQICQNFLQNTKNPSLDKDTIKRLFLLATVINKKQPIEI